MGNNDITTTGGYISQHLPEEKGLSEKERNELNRRVALEWISEHPGRYARLCQVRLARMLGSAPDGWAATYLWPTRENDEITVRRYQDARNAGASGMALSKEARRSLNNRGAFLKFILDILAPLSLLALVLAFARWRELGPVLMPWGSYALGLTFTVSAQRYTLPAEPLLHIILAVFLASVLFKTEEMPWPKRRTKAILAVSVLAVYNLVGGLGLTKGLYQVPPAAAPAAPVSVESSESLR